MIPYARLNKGYKYILVWINVFTKNVLCEPLKNKTNREVTMAMEKILSKIKVPYQKYYKYLFQKTNLNHSTYSSIVERVNRTLETKMFKQLSL